jgi:ABC-type multidrug transport system fused ATPase/permease subunit
VSNRLKYRLRSLSQRSRRICTAEHADRILLIDHGRLVEDGPHDDLVARGGRYAALHRQWRSGTGPAPGPEAG